MTDRLPSFFEPEGDLIKLIIEGRSDDLPALFVARTNRWRSHIMIGEYTAGTFDDLSQRLAPERAYALIPAAAQLALNQTDLTLFTTALSLLTDIARRSETTEMPEVLTQQWPQLIERMRTMPKEGELERIWEELCRWYRKHTE